MKTKIRPNPYRRYRRRHRASTPVTTVLRLVENRLDNMRETVRSVDGFRKGLRALTEDDRFWKQLEQLRLSVHQLNCSLDDLL
jgi:hypothetical protein